MPCSDEQPGSRLQGGHTPKKKYGERRKGGEEVVNGELTSIGKGGEKRKKASGYRW